MPVPGSRHLSPGPSYANSASALSLACHVKVWVLRLLHATPPLVPTQQQRPSSCDSTLCVPEPEDDLLALPGTIYSAPGTWQPLRRAVRPRIVWGSHMLALLSWLPQPHQATAARGQRPRTSVKSYLTLPASSVAAQLDSRNTTRAVPSPAFAADPRPSFTGLPGPSRSPARSSVPFLSWRSLSFFPLHSLPSFKLHVHLPLGLSPPCQSS